jgi:hypothetical protein
MKIETPILKRKLYVYTTDAEYEGIQYEIVTIIQKIAARTTYSHELRSCSKKRWIFPIKIPEKLLRYVEKEVRKRHFQQK